MEQAAGVEQWTGVRLAGRRVVLEPLSAEHEDGIWDASRDPATWRWLSVPQPPTREALRRFLDDALAAAAEGVEIPFATVFEGRVVGSTRYLALAPEHRRLEIGWTWLHPSAWRSGVNVEAKLLQLDDAFGRLGCRRVELKTDALNERSRAALAALPAAFEGVFRKHMLVRGGENRDSAWYAIVDDDWPAVRENLELRLARAVAAAQPPAATS